MAHYLTRQRRLLLDYLAQHPDESLSALQISADLADQGISASAVYRNLTALEEENQLRKIGIGTAGQVYYQYIGTAHCRDSLHFSCIKCKQTRHISTDTAQALLDMLNEKDHCTISKEHTVLYGLCRNCRQY